MRTSSLVLGGGVLGQFAHTVRIRFIFQGIGDTIVLFIAPKYSETCIKRTPY